MKPWHIILAILLISIVMARKPLIEMMDKFTRSQFISTFGGIVRNAASGTGLFPSVFMAQAILESGNGNSTLTKKAYNFFGIKASPSWKGEIYTIKTKEYDANGKEYYVNADFRKYPHPEDSFLDRVKFLVENSRYRNNGVFAAQTPEDQARALQRAGYATDPAYADLLIKLINQNNLKSLDV